MPFTWNINNFTNDMFKISTISSANSPEKYTIPHQINLENEEFNMQFTWNSNNFKFQLEYWQFHMPSTWKIHNFTHNSPRIWTISHAIYMKYTKFYKRFVHDINNFVNQFT